MTLLSTLYITHHQARLSVRNRSLLVQQPERAPLKVPIEQLDAIVVVGGGQMTSDVMALCAQHAICITGLSSGGKVRYVVNRGLSGNVHLRLRQYRAAADDAFVLLACRVLVAGKLANARRAALRWSWDAPIAVRRAVRKGADRIGELVAAVWEAQSPDHCRGMEGEGTRTYFAVMREHLRRVREELTFDERSRRPPRDEVNASLSFTYALALGQIVGALEAVGLDPQVGFLHRPRPGRPALALDLLEEFRASVADRFALGLLARRVLIGDSFTRTPGGGCYLSDEGRRDLLRAWDAYQGETVNHGLVEREMPRRSLAVTQATIMARWVRGDLPQYAPFLRDD